MTAYGTIIAGNSRDGKLVCIGANHYEGTKPMPNGKQDRKKFKMPKKDAIAAWTEWRDEEPDTRPDRPKRKKDVKFVNVKGKQMASSSLPGPPKPPEEKVYALAIVGGAPLYVFRSLDKAAAVCDALTQAAKASGFAAKYDVVEVKEWKE